MAGREATENWGGRGSPSATSSSLLRRLQSQEPEAWRRWADLYGPLIYYWCRRHELQPEDAADVFQEVFAAVVGGIRDFRHDRGDGRFRGWLWTITRHKILDHFRRKAGREEAIGGSEAFLRIQTLPEHLGEEPATSPELHQLTALVQRAMSMVQGEFEPGTWRAFWRTVVDHQRTADVAGELGLSVGAVRIAKSRVLRRIRAILGELTK